MVNYIKTKDNLNSMNKIFLFILIFFMSFSSVFSAQEVLTYYDFEEGTGSVVIDKTINNYNSLITGAIYSNTIFKFGFYGMDFSGTNQWIESIGETPNSNEYAVSMWVRPSSQGGFRSFFDSHNTALGQTHEFEIKHDFSSGGFYVDYVDSLSVTQTQQLDSVLIPENDVGWTHFVVAVDYTTKNLTFWKNKVNVGTINLPLLYRSASPQNNIRIGTSVDGNLDYNGGIDEVRILNFIPSDIQVAQLYDANTIIFEDETPSEEEVIEIVETLPYTIIQSTTPINSSSVINQVLFSANLDYESTCDLYIDDSLTYTFENILAFSQLKSLSIGNHSYFVYCSFQDGNISYYDISNVTYFEVEEGNPSTINFVFMSEDFSVTSQNLYVITPCLDKGILIPTISKPYNRYANKNDVYFDKVSSGQATFTLPLGKYEFCLINGIAQYNVEDGFSSVWEVNNVQNQLKLGDYDLPSNVTSTFFVGLETSDLYKVSNPKWWGTSWVEIIAGLVLLILGVLMIWVGIVMKEPKVILVGGILCAVALGFQLPTLLAILT